MYDGEQSNLDAPPPEETSNRTFLIVAGILGGIVLLSLACVAAYVLFVYPSTQKQQQAAIATQNAQNAQVALALTSTAQAASFPTETETPPPTQTPVIAQATDDKHAVHGYTGPGNCHRRCGIDPGRASPTDHCANHNGFARHRPRGPIWCTRSGAGRHGADRRDIPGTQIARGTHEIIIRLPTLRGESSVRQEAVACLLDHRSYD